MNPLIDILLATYNGERFLAQQLDSVLNQSFQDFRIIIRDDGSRDNTLKIINEYVEKYPAQIYLVQDGLGNLGALQNFNELAKYSTSNYISFCDQDDIWLSDKLKKSFELLAKAEQKNLNQGIFVYTDMKIIDENDQLTHDSFWKLASLHPKYFMFSRLLMQSIPHGCTMLMNKKLKDQAFPIPQNAILHDHWLSLVAVNFGQAIPIFESLVLIRNHGANVTQKKTNNFKRLQRFYKNFGTKDEYLKYLNIRLGQGKAFYDKYYSQLSVENKYTLDQFLLLGKTSGWERKLIYIKNKFYRTTFFHTLKMLWRA